MLDNNKLQKGECYIKLLFIIISILCMNSLLYSKLSSLYKLSTVLMILLFLILLVRRKYYSTDIFMTFSFLIGTNILSAIINIKHSFVGNMLEVVFMCTYIFIIIIGDREVSKKVFNTTSHIVQGVSFIVALFGTVLVLTGFTITFTANKSTYVFGIDGGRFWGVVNPNAAAIFSYISIILAILLIIKKSRYTTFLKVNIALQIFYFLLQQSRGAMLSVLLMVAIYYIFISKAVFKKRIINTVLSCIAVVVLSMGSNYVVSGYSSLVGNRIVDLDLVNSGNSDIKKNEDKEKNKEVENRILETGSSGRVSIWKGALKMGANDPVFGIGNRNIAQNYEKYFEKFEISNSLKGGNFHNIFITVFVSTGIIGLASFVYLLYKVGRKFVEYILGKDNDSYTKVLLLPFFGILLGQLFESTILYSTNFINIFFWMIIGIGLISIREDKLKNYEEITDLKELQKRELDTLEYIHNICEQQGYKYFLAYGTLIGAVRHKGFIPWDDDVDIVMPREDYEKLQKYLLEQKDERFEVMSYLNNKNYIYQFMKVKDKETYLEEEDIRINPKMGVYIDIFPLDGHAKDENFKNKMTKLLKKTQLSSYTFKGIQNKNNIVDTLIRYVCLYIFYFANTNKYVRKIDELAKSRKIDDCEYIDYVSLKGIKEPMMKKDWFKESIDIEFCGKIFKAPAEYDKVLRADYGDYMQLPPKEEQVTHHSFKAWKLKK